jgi:NADH:ubiquinone oxidoreductase subunit H
VVILIVCTYSILLDELIMSFSQRRIGPYNIGGYGIFPSLINGCNLILCQFIILKLQFNYGFQSFPILSMLISLANYSIVYPFFLIDITLSLLLLLLSSTLSIVFLILLSFSASSKYSILGCIRIITQLISSELIWTTILLILIWSTNNYCITTYYLYTTAIISISFVLCYFSIIFIFFISILADCNRIPHDLCEAESESVAGYITEYSSIYFSIILLTEYSNIIVFIWLIIVLFSITAIYFIYFLFTVCLIRSSLTRVKFNELMISSWLVILPFISVILLLYLIIAVIIEVLKTQ